MADLAGAPALTAVEKSKGVITVAGRSNPKDDCPCNQDGKAGRKGAASRAAEALAALPQGKGHAPSRQANAETAYAAWHGVSNIEITDANIKVFESTAKKYGIDFALKKTDDRYLVFFKGRDADVLTAAFREFSKKKLDKERKPSVRRDLAEKKAEAAQTAKRDKVKNMDRGIDR